MRDGGLKPADVRRAVFALLGEIAESASCVRQRRSPSGSDIDLPSPAVVSFEVATGMLEGDNPCASHGHTLILRVVPRDE